MKKKAKSIFNAFHITVFVAALILGQTLFSYADTTTTHATGADYVRQLKLFEYVVQMLRLSYASEPEPDVLVAGAIEGMLDELDEHTMYFDGEEFQLLLHDAGGSFGGMGVTIQVTPEDNTLTIMSVMEGTPAERVGLMARDKIIEIEGETTRDITSHEAIKKMRGEPGTELNITIAREGLGESKEINLTREIIHIDAIPYYYMVSDDVGYIRLLNFARDEERSTTEDLKAAIADLKSQGMEKLILDLKGNPGGLLDEAVGVTNCFLPDDKLIVSTKGRSSRWKNAEYFTEEAPVWPAGKTAILIDSASASASEIVTGALKDYGRATIIGETTFGKASVQSIVPFQSMTDENGKYPGMKITVAHYYTPNGYLIHDAGIEPDIALEREEYPLIVNKLFLEGQFRVFAQKYHDEHSENTIEAFLADPLLVADFKRMLADDGFQFYPEAYAETLPDDGMEFVMAEIDENEEKILRMMTREMYREIEGDARAWEYWQKDDPWVKRAVEELS
ncbi:MAG: S41 family peptidase [bacterium]|nr:S41 family peptidase [bacterium]